jgi:predicted secreted protein
MSENSEFEQFGVENKHHTMIKTFAISLFAALFAYSCFSQNELIKKEALFVNRDSVFTISLSASFGEGYSWRLVQNPDSNYIRFLKMTQAPGVIDKDGAQETQQFLFKGIKKGKCTLQFVYEQPWLKEKSPKLNNKSFSIIIN